MKRTYVYFGIFITVLIIAGAIYFIQYPKKPQVKSDEKDEIIWLVDKEGYLFYPLNRGNISFNRENYAQTDNLTLSRIIYKSRNGNIYGFLVLPKQASDLMPGVVLLPGAGVSKESELALARKIAELGAAVLVIDQRGVGETDGKLPSLDEDYGNFVHAKEPVQHLLVYDALRGYDLLYSAPFVDSDRIIIAGESLGGRIAIIAAAIDRNIKGVLAISTAGFDFKGGPDEIKNTFLKSIDPDHYFSLITPRKLVMMHNAYDNNIPLNSALRSYAKAQEPKQFVLVNDTTCNHGYCDSMYDGLVESLDYLIDIRSKTLVSVPERN
ncbi:alpha/beta hydrolase [Candidatus Woesearchaeota archaeon]|nr:alpha/beta hydrolase [Candidatus Woesearchaeota archaeon]